MKTLSWTTAVVLLAMATPLLAAEEQQPADPGRTRLLDPAVDIPLDLDARMPMVQVHIDGHGPYRFVVDTGAAFSLVDAGIAQELDLEVVGRQIIRSPGASADIEGQRVQPDRVQVGRVLIDKPVLATMELVEFSGGLLQGVLGMAHFQDLLLTFDYPGARLQVAPGKLDEQDPATLTYDPSTGHVRFPLQVAGQTLPTDLDTGSPGGFTVPKAMEKDLRFRADPVPGGSIMLVGGSHSTWNAQLDGTILLAGLSYKDPEITLSTMGKDFGNIGFGVLNELVVTLDQSSRLVRLQRPDAAASPAPMVIRKAAGPRKLGVGFNQTPSGFVKQDGGLVVRLVDKGGAADLAGLRVGDVVMAADGTSLAEVEEIAEIGRLLRVRPLRLDVVRDGKEVAVVIP